MSYEQSTQSARREKSLELLAQLRVMDDDFMRCVFRSQPALVQQVLRIVIGVEDLHVIAEETQRDLKRLVGARSVELDVWATDSSGTDYDIEVQRGDNPYPRRLRYHSACMDVESLEKGEPFSKLPEQWVVFITERDPFGEGKGTYLYEYAREGKVLGDGTHYLYVNGSYRGDDELGSLMHDFCQNDPDKIRNQLLADRVRYWKENQEGVHEMCEILEKMCDEAKREGMQQGMQQGMEQGMQQMTLRDTRSLMETLQLTAQQALEALRVPEADRPKYLAML